MLITAAEVVDTLPGLSPSDSLLVRLLGDTDAWAKQMLGRVFERAVYELHPRVYRLPYVLLRESPIRRVVSASSLGVPIDASRFTFNPDPQDDDNRLNFEGVTISEGRETLVVNVEAGWWPVDDPDNETDLPEELRGWLIKRARAEFKRSAGVSDEETKAVTDDAVLAALRKYKR